MAYNKGKKLVFCEKCKKKRYCTSRILLPARDYKKWTCSKGHEWDIRIGPLGQIISIEMDRLIQSIKENFFRNDTFYKYLRR